MLTLTTRPNARAIYRGLRNVTGWVSRAECARAAERLARAGGGTVDRASDIRVASRTRRTVTLEVR